MTADTVGGVWTYAVELARALAARRVEVALATMGAPLSAEQRREGLHTANLELFESRFKLEWMEEPWEDVAGAGEWLLDIEGRVRPDVVHLNGYAHAALAWRAPALVVGHSCVLSWWMAVRGAPAPASWDRYRHEVGRGLRAARLVIAPSKTMLSALERFYGPLGRARVIPNGRDPELFPPGVKEPFVFAAGRLWDEAKNVEALARVAPRLAWPVYVAGEGSHPEGGAARHGGLRPLGRLPSRALADWFARAAVYALPARYEPFGLSALEAGLAGCALVLGDIPSLREVWGDAAVFVDPFDDGAIRAALQSLLADPVRLADLGRRAQERARTFTPGRMADGYLDVYARLPVGGPR